jgi:hypothetical protein
MGQNGRRGWVQWKKGLLAGPFHPFPAKFVRLLFNCLLFRNSLFHGEYPGGQKDGGGDTEDHAKAAGETLHHGDADIGGIDDLSQEVIALSKRSYGYTAAREGEEQGVAAVPIMSRPMRMRLEKRARLCRGHGTQLSWRC